MTETSVGGGEHGFPEETTTYSTARVSLLYNIGIQYFSCLAEKRRPRGRGFAKKNKASPLCIGNARLLLLAPTEQPAAAQHKPHARYISHSPRSLPANPPLFRRLKTALHSFRDFHPQST